MRVLERSNAYPQKKTTCDVMRHDAGPVAMVVAVKLCQSSGFGGPGTFVVVFLHMFIKLIQLFGDDDFTNPERVRKTER